MGDTKITAKPSDAVTARITSINGIPVDIKAQEIQLPLVPPKSGGKHIPTFYYMPEKRTEKPNMKQDVDIDGDGIADKFHSDIGVVYLRNQCRTAIQSMNPNEEKPDVVVDTETASISITDLQKQGLPVTQKNLSQYKNKLIGRFVFGTDLYRNAELNKFNNQKVPIFVSARNDPDAFAFESLLPGTITVGALEADPEKGWQLERADYSSNTDLVKQWEQGTYPVRVIRNTKGEIIGYNITNGKTIDIPVGETSAKGQNVKTGMYKWGPSGEIYELVENVLVIGGTSWAAPTAAGKRLRKKFGDACDLPADKK